MSGSAIDWHPRAAALQPDGRCVIDGQRRPALSDQTSAKHSPMAFEDRRWAGMAPKIIWVRIDPA